MRKLYDEFFYVPKHGKIREKVMLTRMAMTIVIMVVCLVAMGITAYAYFTYNVTSGPNSIKAADFDANVLITASDAKTIPLTKDGKIQTVTLEAGEYEIELSKGESTADKGFCVITIGDKKYYTDQIGGDADKKLDDAKVEFTLSLSAPTKIEVLSHWGTSVYYDYKDVDRTEIFIKNGNDLDLTTKTSDDESGETADQPEEKPTEPELSSPQGSENTTTPPTEATKPAETTPPETTEPTDTTESSASTSEPETTEPTPSTEPTETESTESAETETTDPAETPPATENTETAGAPTTETNE